MSKEKENISDRLLETFHGLQLSNIAEIAESDGVKELEKESG